MQAKLKMLRQLGDLTKCGVKLSQNYNMNSDYRTMKYEHELHKGIRDKHMGIKWLNNLLLNICYGIEMGNEHFNPFDFKLKGWSEQMDEKSDEYYDVLGELYDKYCKEGKPFPPELKLMFMVSGSAIQFHLSYAMLNSGVNAEDELKNNPSLAQKLREKIITNKNNLNKQHEVVKQKVDDINKINQDQKEYRTQQEIFEKQKQLQELQNQLLQQRSDTRSSYPTGTVEQKIMTSPVIPASLKNRFPTPPINTNLQMQEYARQQQIIQHKKNMEKQEFEKKINPDIDSIINEKFSDTQSRISMVTESEKTTTKSKRGRKKKPIQIIT